MKYYLPPVPDSGEVKMPGQQEQRPGQDAEAGGAHQGVDQAELQPHALLSLQIRTFKRKMTFPLKKIFLINQTKSWVYGRRFVLLLETSSGGFISIEFAIVSIWLLGFDLLNTTLNLLPSALLRYENVSLNFELHISL